ncbi:hypothetical protein BGX26_009903 [Mortierella sp. AD094]|nr:hypothetical protein BGX26_009903 [Mortierella sp. AD094]
MSDLSFIEDHLQPDPSYKEDLLDKTNHNIIEQEQELDGHKFQGSPPLSGRSLSNRHSHQPSSSSSSSSSSSDFLSSSATAPQSSSSSVYRAGNDRRRQSRGHDGVFARPNSIVSIYGSDLPTTTTTTTARGDNSSSSKRSSKLNNKEGNHNQQKPAPNTLSSRNEKESNDAFDRICSILTHLIVDASTAASSSPSTSEGGGVSAVGVIPTIVPLIYSGSDSSDADDADDDDAEDNITKDNKDNNDESKDTQEKRQDLVDLDRDDRAWDRGVFRRRSGLFNERNLTKRRSLFLELQSCQPPSQQEEEEVLENQLKNDGVEVQDSVDQDTYHHQQQRDDAVVEVIISHQEPSPTEAQPVQDKVPPWIHSAEEYTTEQPDGLLHPHSAAAVTKGLRRCASFPSMKSDMIEMQHQQVIQHMDSELDKTVETIDGLTRDLVAIATHQSWMQMNLERSNQFQTLQYGRRSGKAYASRRVSSDYFRQLSRSDSDVVGPAGAADTDIDAPMSPMSPTLSSHNDFSRQYWDADNHHHQSLFWGKENELLSNGSNGASTTLPEEGPLFQMFIRPNAPKSSVSTDDNTIAGSEFGPGSPTPSSSSLPYVNSRGYSKYFDSLQTIAAQYEEPHMRNLGHIHADIDDDVDHDDDDDDDVLDSLREYRGESFRQGSISNNHNNNSQRSSGSSFTLADTSSCRTSALSFDGTLITPLDTTFSNYKDEQYRDETCSPPPRFSGSDYVLEKEKFSRTSVVDEPSTSCEMKPQRIRRSAMPGAWPTSISDTILSSSSDQDNALDAKQDLYMLQEDADSIFNLVNGHIQLALLVFWTVAFVAGTVVMNHSLVEKSSSRARISMNSVDRLVLADISQSRRIQDDEEEEGQGEDEDTTDLIVEAMQLLKKSEHSIMSTKKWFEDSKLGLDLTSDLTTATATKKEQLSQGIGRTTSMSGSVAGSRSRRRQVHQRRQRDWMIGSSSSTWSSSSPNLLLYRGSPILRTMKFCSTSSISEASAADAETDAEIQMDRKAKAEMMMLSGAESLSTLVDLAD